MKKVLLGLAALAMVACLASCKKNCDCSVTAAGVSVHYDYTVEELNDIYSEVSSCSDVWERSYETMKCE